MLLKDARDEFLFDCECKHLAKGTIRNYKAETRFLVEFLELKQVTEVEEVKAHHIRDFMKQKQDAGSSACYVNDILKVCKTWFHYLVDEDYALTKGLQYANQLHMSKQAIYDQLTSSYGEGFPADAAQYAVDNMTGVDWNANALEKAKQYYINRCGEYTIEAEFAGSSSLESCIAAYLNEKYQIE